MKISGPVNIVKLRGNVNSIDKTFYIFCDIHVGFPNQTECLEIRAMKIKEFLIHKFDTTDKEIDFFMEVYPTEKASDYFDIYIRELWNFFSKSLNYDYNINKIKRSEEFPKVRFHYIDIREYIYQYEKDYIVFLGNIINTLFRYTSSTITMDTFNYIFDSLFIVSNRLLYIYGLFYGNKTGGGKIHLINKSILGNEENIAVITQIITKITSNYKNDFIKGVINKFINDLKQSFDKYIELYGQVGEFKDQIQKLYNISSNELVLSNGKYFYDVDYIERRKLYDKFVYHVYEMNELIMNIYSSIMDVYMLRRGLDKDYIKTVYSYTGIFHSINYIYVLVKYLNFKIVDCSYKKYDDLEERIKKIDHINVEQMNELFYPPKLNQCSTVGDKFFD